MPSAIGKTILVVDDEAPIRRVIELKLRKAGYNVLLASNGEEGLELIRALRPDAVITDVMMPKMTGRQMCEATEGMKAAGKIYEPVTYDGAGHGFMRAGEAPDANVANKKARDDAFKRWLELLKKV